jgi:hypothetical protein
MAYMQDYLPPGRDQLMRPPVLASMEKTKEIRYPGLRLRADAVGPSPFLRRPRSARTLLSALALAPLALRLVFRPFRSVILFIVLARLHMPSLPLLTPTSVVHRRSMMAALHLSSPNSCAIEVFRAVRFPSVAFFISRHMVACCAFQRLQCLKKCSRV